MADNTLTLEQQIAKLMEENNALKTANKAKAPGITLKVGEKGGLCIYGLGRFPINLYRSQAERLFTPEMCKRVTDFIEQNKATLKVKE
jgi:hypothetical protein